ncbi:MAG: hypothetical protein KatS3mg068_0846 [Candidatus Sericytochromatia bacterium]|nr:MAG: hypothetical protein KatS3mg068_0846 [Candidatus Sericytochromatia bacterium]
MFKYKIYDLKIISNISLSDIEEYNFDSKEDIKIIANQYNNAKEIVKDSFIIKNDIFELVIKDIGIFNIVENNLNIYYFKETRNEEISLYILGTCIGYFLYKNNYLPLHGSSIYTDKGAVFFIGDSGYGKSTILNLFIKKNYKMISDDVIALKKINNEIIVFPSFPRSKIWKDTANKLDIEVDNLKQIYKRLDKFSYPIPKNLFFNSTTKPYIIYELLHYDIDKVIIEEVKNKFEIVKRLYKNTYRLTLMNNLKKNKLQFDIITKISNFIKFKKIYRPKNYNCIDELVILIEKDFLSD